MAQEIAGAGNFAVAKGELLRELGRELDFARLPDDLELAEGQDGFTEVSKLVPPNLEPLEGFTAVAVPERLEALVPSIDARAPSKNRSIAVYNSTSGSSRARLASRSSRFQASQARLTISMFSWDIAEKYPASGTGELLPPCCRSSREAEVNTPRAARVKPRNTRGLRGVEASLLLREAGGFEGLIARDIHVYRDDLLAHAIDEPTRACNGGTTPASASL